MISMIFNDYLDFCVIFVIFKTFHDVVDSFTQQTLRLFVYSVFAERDAVGWVAQRGTRDRVWPKFVLKQIPDSESFECHLIL